MHIVSTNDIGRRYTNPDQQRIAPLSVLPVFLDLKRKPVLVVGGSEAAAWKAHLLAAAGAEVRVFAEELDASFGDLFPDGSFEWQRAAWSERSLNGVHLAVADLETDAEAQAFVAAARSAGVPVNVIDKPEFCQFQFGSIVNRSPVVVGISTAGVAPVLGQAVRRRIETLLPDFLADWAGIAGRMRKSVMARLSPGAQRRSFWERFAEAAFRSAPVGNEAERWIGGAVTAPSGRVTLVGAGPGDAEYLTIKAVRALQAADVILFDDFVSNNVLELARREARRILIGKRGGRKNCAKDDITQMMISLAHKGRHVVRLMSGGPTIFGCGEEIVRLKAEGIHVEVVPGITTPLTFAAELGRTLTHRDHARSARFVIWHTRSATD